MVSNVALSPEASRLLHEASAAATYDEAMPIVDAFDFDQLPADEREELAQLVLDALRELPRE